MSCNKEKKIKSLWLIIGIFVLGGIIGLLFSFGVAVGVHKTSDDKFCTMCHTMQPMANSYYRDAHGGNNVNGVRAKCVDCHLPHDSLANYLFEKAKTGLHDVRVQNFGDLESIDWEEKRKHAKRFVFDSGCMNCHTNLQNATSSNTKAFIAHKEYFEKRTDKKCVECHKNVGHHILGDYIKK
ncbi:cytochrome c3 family protein [Arcobacter sp.]|uniref:cytochrome c3 family protein n=2 Tax=unclassified Arcobacter TaxID=2593671 RepID=UPI003AFFA5B3